MLNYFWNYVTMMTACIIIIGNEIIDGTRLDTNSKWIAEKITHYGITTDKIISVGDNVVSIFSLKDNITNFINTHITKAPFSSIT